MLDELPRSTIVLLFYSFPLYGVGLRSNQSRNCNSNLSPAHTLHWRNYLNLSAFVHEVRWAILSSWGCMGIKRHIVQRTLSRCQDGEQWWCKVTVGPGGGGAVSTLHCPLSPPTASAPLSPSKPYFHGLFCDTLDLVRVICMNVEVDYWIVINLLLSTPLKKALSLLQQLLKYWGLLENENRTSWAPPLSVMDCWWSLAF